MSSPQNMRDTVILVSSDNKQFPIMYNIAILSETIKTFISTTSGDDLVIHLPINSCLLKRCLEFMQYKYEQNYASAFEVRDDEAVELLDVASYLRL